MIRRATLMMFLVLGASAHAENRVTVLADGFSRKPDLTRLHGSLEPVRGLQSTRKRAPSVLEPVWLTLV
jgi:hypothetical protein